MTWEGDVRLGVEAWGAGEPPPDVAAGGPDADAEEMARKILLDQLTGRARSRKELADKLARKNVPGDVATALLDRFAVGVPVTELAAAVHRTVVDVTVALCARAAEDTGVTVVCLSGGCLQNRILATDLHSDGRYADLLYVDGGPSSTGTAGVVRMSGQEVFKHAVVKLAQTGAAALARAGLTTDDVGWLVPHQANLRIMTMTAHKLGLPMERVVVTVQDHGNTSAASIPLALSVAHAGGRILPGDVLLMEAIGGGLAWGAAVLRW